MGVLEFLNILIRHRYKVLLCPLALVGIVLVCSFISDDTYTSKATFRADISGRGGRASELAGLASQFGVNVGETQNLEGPDFYAEILKSRRVLSDVARTSFFALMDEKEAQSQNQPGTLVDHWTEPQSSETRRILTVVGRLRKSLDVEVDQATGIVTLGVTVDDGRLAKQIASHLLETLEDYNLEVRQSRAAARAKFISERLKEARSELRSLEDSLETFLTNNRQFQNSPTLRFEHARLSRRVERHEELVGSLVQSYEQARIEKVKNTPVITVIDKPVRPSGPDSDQLLFKLGLSILIGTAIGFFWAILASTWKNAERNSREEIKEFNTLKSEVKADLFSKYDQVRTMVSRFGRRE